MDYLFQLEHYMDTLHLHIRLRHQLRLRLCLIFMERQEDLLEVMTMVLDVM